MIVRVEPRILSLLKDRGFRPFIDQKNMAMDIRHMRWGGSGPFMLPITCRDSKMKGYFRKTSRVLYENSECEIWDCKIC
jgi:hypothetical protein